MAIWLAPKPEEILGFVMTVKNEDEIGKVIDALRPLRLSGITPGCVHIGNDLRVLSSRMQRRDLVKHSQHVHKDYRKAVRDELGIGAWNLMSALYGSHRTVQSQKREIQRALKGLGRLAFFSQKALNRVKAWEPVLRLFPFGRKLLSQIHSIQPAFSLLQGTPNSAYLKGSGWADSRPITAEANYDPRQQGSGMLWVALVIPMVGKEISRFTQMTEEHLYENGFDPLMTLATLNGRCVAGVVTICFNKMDPIEASRAQACHDSYLQRCIEEGYIPYRSGLLGMAHLIDPASAYGQILARIKDALDPEQVIAPGRYITNKRHQSRFQLKR